LCVGSGVGGRDSSVDPRSGEPKKYSVVVNEWPSEDKWPGVVGAWSCDGPDELAGEETCDPDSDEPVELESESVGAHEL
jgi:hypothetical protein